MRLHGRNLRDLRRIALDLLRDGVRVVEREVARQLQVQSHLDAAVDLDDHRLWIPRTYEHGERGGE